MEQVLGEPAGQRRPDDSWIEAIRRAGRELEDSLTDPARLKDLTVQLAAVAADTGAAMITGASPLGHQLAGLVVGMTKSPVALWAQNGAHGTVLVIEGVLASGAQLTSTARRARAAGAVRVVGAAVIAEPNGLASCRKELGDEIRALRELVVAS
ncbi:MAG: hypothetical protein ACHQ01_07535 [Candidatus Limnocylindrales bacterium]